MSSTLTIRIKRAAMGCEFELVLRGEDREYLVNAAEEAFEEVKRLEEQLSVFIPTSEISYINAVAGSKPVRVEPRLFRLLETASRISRETEGAFDITAGALIDLWKSADHAPSAAQLQQALESTGMSKIILDEAETTVRFANPGVKLDLGAIGKGYAAREVVEFLVERGITGALVAAGTSTVYALGSPPDDDAWTVGIKDPISRDKRITSVSLRDRAVSTSGSHERYVEIGGERFSHIIDPRTGRPASGLLLACAVTEDPVESDALSTAFFIQGADWTRGYCESRGDVGAILVSGDEAPVIQKIGVE
jgi:thiamine biosynthesis lipoprotein